MINTDVLGSPTEVAVVVANELLRAITKDQTQKLVALTGGTLGIEVIREFGKIAQGDLPVSFVFGDERFVALDHSDRNEHQGLQAWPRLGTYLTRYPDPNVGLDSARESFEIDLQANFGAMPRIDITILGMGPDGHVASLFPGHNLEGDLVVAESNSPKPPAQRLSLSYSALNNSTEVWFVASGAAKADAVKCALSGNCELPVGKVRGLSETRWFIDLELSREL